MADGLHRGFMLDSSAPLPLSLHVIPKAGEKVADAGKLGNARLSGMNNMGVGAWIQPIAAIPTAISANVVGLFFANPRAAALMAHRSMACRPLVNNSRSDCAIKNLALAQSCFGAAQEAVQVGNESNDQADAKNN